MSSPFAGHHQYVDDVLLSIDGSIDCLRTRRTGAVKGSLYVDCTGFRGLLINQALQEPFVSFQEVLLNDRAVALQVPYPADRSDIEPSSATALSSGWVWNIPLLPVWAPATSIAVSRGAPAPLYRRHHGAGCCGRLQ
ncbi:tryptophan 7-halogenase [Bradyrhizobium sp. Pear77]|uniref:tryptophan 7-halogenase n=1 Tax=Bradyrhizobium altum TaxID=1571202 RepID=UPI0035D9C3F5|nr:tryptophan 7-halogenase [Bradyrhizobium altum]